MRTLVRWIEAIGVALVAVLAQLAGWSPSLAEGILGRRAMHGHLSWSASSAQERVNRASELPRGPDEPWWAGPGRADGVAAPAYAGIARTSRYIALRDGVRLALDLYLPQGLQPGARLPAILEQTRYVRGYEYRPEAREQDRPRRQVAEFVTRGYAYVVVDVRGTGASFGNRSAELSQLEVRDGADVVDWIVAQPWSNGKVGATGISYVGTTAELLIGNRHPSVKAVAPQFSLYDAYLDIVFPGGIHQTWFTQTWRRAIHGMDENRPSDDALKAVVGTRPVDEDVARSLLDQAIAEHAVNHDVYAELSRIAFRDDVTPAGWTLDDLSPHNFLENARASGAALYSYSGWWDGAYPHSAIKRYLTLRTPGSRLVIGPWSHGGRFVHSPGDGVTKASFDHTRELLRFFEYHLKGLDTGLAAEPPVHYYTMGENRWKAADTWPPPAQSKRYYLASDHGLAEGSPAAGTYVDTYRVDPTTGTGTATRWNTLVGGGAVDYLDRGMEDGKLLTYTSAPLPADMEVTGHPLVTLFASSSASDADFFAYLEEVHESGRVACVTEGQLRAVHRRLGHGPPPYALLVPYRTFLRRDAQGLVPGQVVEMSFDLLPTSYLFRKGRRVRLALAGADKDHFGPLPGEPPTLSVHHNSVHPSSLTLPVVTR